MVASSYDFDLPSLDRTDLDGLFVVLRTIMEDRTHILISDRATYADRLIDLASWFEIDGILLTDPCETGEPHDTILPGSDDCWHAGETSWRSRLGCICPGTRASPTLSSAPASAWDSSSLHSTMH